MGYLIMLLAGLALAGVNTWQRLGRSPAARAWARGHRDFGQRNVLVLWPLIAGALLIGAAIGAAQGNDAATVPLSLLLLLTLGAWLAFAALPLRVPTFLQPRWFREGSAQRRAGSRG